MRTTDTKGIRTDNGAVRLGGGNDGGRMKILIAAGAGAPALIGIVLFVSLSKKEPEAPPPVGCRSDADCDGGRFCAKGGCIVLMSAEHRGIWRDAVAAQAAPGSTWQPDKEVGELLGAVTVCPIPEKAVPEPKVDRMRVEAAARVIEVNSQALRIHQYQKVNGEVWVDTIRFTPDPLATPDAPVLCGTENTAGLRVGKDARGKPFADVLLKTAAPARKSVTAGIVFFGTAPAPGPDGRRALRFSLMPPALPGIKEHSVAVFPLGTDIYSISGPKPIRQKLLKGYILYDFIHTASPATVAFEYKCNTALPAAANLTGEPLRITP